MSQAIIEDEGWKAIMADPQLAAARRKLSFHEIRLIVQHAQAALAATPLASLKAENEALRELLERVTDSLEAELQARYPIEAEGHAPYLGMKRRYDRDMAEVHEARAALTKQGG